MLHHNRTFEEKRIRSRSADPSRRFRKTDIFNTETTDAPTKTSFDHPSSEYKKAFVWPKNQLDSLNEESLQKRLNPSQKQHPAGLSSRRAAHNNKAHIIENSNGSRSIVIANEPTDFALTTGSATNLASLTNSIIVQDAVRPLTSMALVDSDLNKSISSSNGSAQVNKSVTLANINDFADRSSSRNDQEIAKATAKKQVKESQSKDTNNNNTAVIQPQNGLNGDLLLEKLSKLNTYESIYGKKAGASTLFHREELIDASALNKIPKKSEYKSKFKPFSTYVYVTGKGWFKPKKVKAKEEVQVRHIEQEVATPAISIKPQEASSVKSQDIKASITKEEAVTAANTTAVSINGEAEKKPASRATDEIDAIIEEKEQSWYKEALERKLKANEFRFRSEYGNPILGRSSLEEVYRKASGNHWQCASDAKFCQLQQMRSSNSAFLPFDQHKKKLQEDKTDSSNKAKATPSKSPRAKRAKSVPPRKKSTNSLAPTKPSNTAQPAEAKVWIKPKSKDAPTTNGDSSAIKKVQRPPQQQNNLDKELKAAQQKKSTNGSSQPKAVNGGGRASPPFITSAPVRTTQIRTPEDLVGIKSPPPENFLERLDSDPINWTNSITNPSSLSSNATYTRPNLMDEFNPTSIRSDNLADLSGLKI